MIKKYKIYIASGWWTPEQIKTYDIIHSKLDMFSREFDVYYPKEQFQFKSGTKPDAETMKRVFNDNTSAIDNCDFVICSTESKDMGSVFESGYAYKSKKPIIYVCLSLGNKPLNLMLAQSGIACITNENDLSPLLECISAFGLTAKELEMFKYNNTIE